METWNMTTEAFADSTAKLNDLVDTQGAVYGYRGSGKSRFVRARDMVVHYVIEDRATGRLTVEMPDYLEEYPDLQAGVLRSLFMRMRDMDGWREPMKVAFMMLSIAELNRIINSMAYRNGWEKADPADISFTLMHLRERYHLSKEHLDAAERLGYFVCKGDEGITNRLLGIVVLPDEMPESDDTDVGARLVMDALGITSLYITAEDMEDSE